MPETPLPPPPDDVLDRLGAASDTVLAALEAYGRGEVDVDGLRRRAFDAGVIRDGSVLWLLDLAGGRWVRYDGLGLEDLQTVIDGV